MKDWKSDEIRPIVPASLQWRQPRGDAEPNVNEGRDASPPTSVLTSPESDSPFFGAIADADASSKMQLIAAVRANENKSTGWVTKILLAVGSLIFFVAIGAAVWSPKLVWMLAVVLFFHEAGHYIAMRTFGYRNVKMFFIPMLGAAVSGQHFNIAAWKKAIVYLAGPLPGIVASLPIIAAGMHFETPWVVELGGLALVLNLLNLLPLMPLDGGWIMHLTVFSRSPILDLAARVIAVVVMFAGGIWIGDKTLMFISIPLLMSLPMTFRVAQLVSRLRGEPIAPPHRDQVPDAAIGQIDDAMRTTPLGPLPVAQKAPLVTQVYESVVVQPPGVVATLAIWFLYASSFVIAIGGGLTVMVAGRMMQDDFLPMNLFDSVDQSITVDPRDAKFHLGQQPINGSRLVIVPIDDPAELQPLLERLPAEDLDRYTHSNFGNVWITSVPFEEVDDPVDFDDADINDAGVLVDSDDFRAEMIARMAPIDPATTWLAAIAEQPMWIVSGAFNESFTIRCRAPDAATAKQTVEQHFQTAMISEELWVPTWSPIASPTPEQLACRAVLQKLNDGITAESSPKLHRRLSAINDRFRVGRTKTADAILGDLSHHQAHAKEVQALQLQYTRSVIDDAEGESKKVAEAFLAHQIALAQWLKIDAEGDIDDIQAHSDQYPQLASFLKTLASSLGASDPASPEHHFAAYVSGEVLASEDSADRDVADRGVADRGVADGDVADGDSADAAARRLIELYVHRAADQAACVSAILAMLSENGFTEFSIRFTTRPEHAQ